MLLSTIAIANSSLPSLRDRYASCGVVAYLWWQLPARLLGIGHWVLGIGNAAAVAWRRCRISYQRSLA
ncbi:hypothetical protein [Nostoc sp.]